MNPLRTVAIVFLAVGGLLIAGCAASEQSFDDAADNVIKGLSGQGTLTGENGPDPAAWEHRN